MAGSQADNYKLKRIDFNNKKVAIVLQNTNGPCPLLAVANVLLMRGDIIIHADKSVVSADELLGRVGEYLLDTKVEVVDDYCTNHERNVNDVIQMLPKTQRGIDVNVKFKSITAFEFTSECMLFDFCNARVVHGWLVDPQDEEMYKFVHTMSYNQLVEKQIQLQSIVQQTEDLSKQMASIDIATEGVSIAKEEETAKITREGMLVERFFNESASQLTYHGLSELHSGIKDEELCVFFRNNHFSTLYKHKGELLLLVTDQGYAKEPLVWEQLCQIDGDSIFLRGDYTRYEAMSPSIAAAFLCNDGILENFDIDIDDRTTQSDRDLALAMQMQQEEDSCNAKQQGTGSQHAEKYANPEQKKKHKGDCVVQ